MKHRLSTSIIFLILVLLVFGSVTAQDADTSEPLVLTPIPATGVGGAWVANSGSETSISLYTIDGQFIAIVKATGAVMWDSDGRLTSGDSVEFTQIQTGADSGTWYDIVDMEVLENGLVSITTEEGVFSLLDLATAEEPTSRDIIEADINDDGNLEGQVSYFITGFGAGSFAAYIYADVRNYSIPSLGVSPEGDAEATEMPEVTPEATEEPDAPSPLTREESQELFDSWGPLQLMRSSGMVSWGADGSVNLAGNIEIDMGFETPPILSLVNEDGEDRLLFDTLLPPSDTGAMVIFESTEVNGAQFHIPSFTVTSVGFENETSYFTVDGFTDYTGDYTFEFGAGKFPRGVFITDMNIFTNGAEHYIYGEIELFGATIASAVPDEPIVFTVRDGEYLHLEGEGSVTTIQGEIVTFGN